MDFLDASAGQAIMSRAPKSELEAGTKKRSATGGFAVDKDSGRLIITNPNAKQEEDSKDVLEYLHPVSCFQYILCMW